MGIAQPLAPALPIFPIEVRTTVPIVLFARNGSFIKGYQRISFIRKPGNTANKIGKVPTTNRTIHAAGGDQFFRIWIDLLHYFYSGGFARILWIAFSNAGLNSSGRFIIKK